MANGALWSRGVWLSRVERGVQPWYWKLAKVKWAGLKRKRVQPRWWKLGKVDRVTLKRGEYNHHGGGGSRRLRCPWVQSGWRACHLWTQGAWHHQSHHCCKLIALTIIKHITENKIKSWLEVRVWDSSSNAMDQLPAQVFYKQLHPCILRESTICMHVCMYTRIFKSSTSTSNLCCSTASPWEGRGRERWTAGDKRLFYCRLHKNMGLNE